MPRTFTVDHERLAALQRTARAMHGYHTMLSEHRKHAQNDLERMANLAKALGDRAIVDPTCADRAAVAVAKHSFYRERRVALENDARRIAVISSDFGNLSGSAELLLGKGTR